MDASFLLISSLNGLSFGLLLFLLASGLTLIFSMMGVLNFAHASFYMLGAYVAYSIAQVIGFWWALLLAPLIVGAMGALFERHALRKLHKFGHVPELLITFGLSYIILELVQLIWGRQAVPFAPPESLSGAMFTIVDAPAGLSLAWGEKPPGCGSGGIVCTTFPAFRAFGMGVAVLMLIAIWLLLTRTRIGLVIQASLTHPDAVESLGHNVPRVFMLVFGGGTALAALAGVIGGAMRVTEPSMALTVGAVVFAVIVIGGMGSLAGAFVASVGLGLIDSFAVSSDHSIADGLHALGMAVTPETFGFVLWSVKLSQIAAILPYLLLVLILIFRPKGLFGSREGVTMAPDRTRPSFNRGRWLVWGSYALVMLVAPMLFRSSLSMTMLSQMGIAIIACLAFNMLLGQGGMLSFGHAVYSGLGSFVAIHVLNRVSDGSIALPVSLIPLVGGLGGMAFAVLLGYVTTKKAGTPFAMITLGVGELVAAMSLMFPGFFGGEGGITGNRVAGKPFLGITFGPQVQLYYLIAIYTFVCTATMFAFTRTPLGRMLNAVRDNPERVEFIGYNTRYVRYIAFIASGFFMGIAGGLAALNFEIVTSEVVGALRSGGYLLFTFLGGAVFFFGPIIGAVLLVLALVFLSELTQAWLLYLGLIFTFMVMYAPGGIASLIMMNVRVASFGKLRPLLLPYLVLFVASVVALAGASTMIEMVYHLQLNQVLGPELKFAGVPLNAKGVGSWAGSAALLLAGAVLFEVARRRFVPLWSRIQGEIEREIGQREAAP